MNALQGARQAVEDGLDFGDRPQPLGAGGAAGAVEIHAHLIAHHMGLFHDLGRQHALVGIGLVGQNAERRL